MFRFMELTMKFRPVYWSFVVGTPFVVWGAFALGRRFDANMGGLLLQVFGGFVGLGWMTWMFLELGQALTRLLGASSSGQETEAEELPAPPRPKPAPSPIRRAA